MKERERYTDLAHGPMCRDCGAMVGDTERHDRWHARKDDQPVPHHTHSSPLDPIGPGPRVSDEQFRAGVKRTVDKMLGDNE